LTSATAAGTYLPLSGGTLSGYVSFGNPIANKVLTLWDGSPTDANSNATNFYGFGINENVLRYQVTAGHNHVFFNGSNQVVTFSGSDVGIGISSPSYALDVAGQIHASSSIVINASTFTDTSLNTTSNAANYASNFVSSLTPPWKTVSWTVYGFPNTLSGTGTFNVSQTYYTTGAYTPLPVGIAGFNNNSNSSNCYLQYAGYFSSASGETSTTTSEFAFSFALNSPTGSNIPAYTVSGTTPPKLYLTSYNGLSQCITTGVSDTFYFPSAYIGNSLNSIFLNLSVVDTLTQSAGFFVTSATAYFF
jgi:hypothetical protein